MRLNTGTIIDAGCKVFGQGSIPKYLPLLSWGLEGVKYKTDRFKTDCEKIFARRSQKPGDEMLSILNLYK